MSPKWGPGEPQKGHPEGQNEPPEAPGADVIKMSRFCHPKVPARGPRNTPGTHPRGPQEGPGRPECMHFTCVLRMFYVVLVLLSFSTVQKTS